MKTEKELINLTKVEQIKLLSQYGLEEDEIKKLRYENQRVDKILHLQTLDVKDEVKEDALQGEEIKKERINPIIIGEICKKCGSVMTKTSGGNGVVNYRCLCGAKHTKRGRY